MRVKVQPINVNGRPIFKSERDKREIYVGELKIHENRLHSLGRAVITAQVIDTLDGAETAVLEIYDIALLWAEGARLRIRGFEIATDVQYAQTWDVEVL
jgi:hypothetical protein